MKDKTEFLFENDEDKKIIKKAVKAVNKQRRKNSKYRYIIVNALFVICFLLITFFVSKLIINSKISKMIANEKNTIPSERMNSYSGSLKQITFNEDINKYEILVNKANPVKEEDLKNYTIINVTDNIFDDVKLEATTYKNYKKLKNKLSKKGYYINIRSGYRSFLDSEEVFNRYKKIKGLEYANKYIPKAGTSEHNLGLAIDIVLSKRKNSVKSNYDGNEYEYLEKIISSYGFIIRYPKDKEKITGYSYEPSHLRFVGKKLAKHLKDNNLTLEEYYDKKETE